MEKFNWIKGGTSIVLGFLSAWVGGFDLTLQLLFYLVVLDVITGFTKYTYLKEVNSKEMFFGMLKKIFIFIVIGTSHMLERTFGNAIPIRDVCVMFYIIQEFVSFLENVSVFTPVPDKFKEFFAQLNGKDEVERKEDKK